jgi:peptidyl-prolyl cis-trans isomerase C
MMFFRAIATVFTVTTAMLLAPDSVNAQSVRDRLAKDVVIATVDGEQVLSSQILHAFQQLPREHRQRGLRAVYGQLLEELINGTLLTVHGRLNNLAKDPEVKMAVKIAEDTIVGRIYLNRLVQQSITEEKLQARYDKLAKKTPSRLEVRARHILVSNEDEAKEVIKMIKGGQPFEEVAKVHSKDPAGPQGGDLGYFRQSDMVKPFSDTAFAMKVGEMTETPVKTEFGWHVIKVEDRRKSSVPSFEQVRPQMIRDLGRLITIEILNVARKGAKIERFTLEGQPLPPPSPAKPAKN